MAKNGGPAQEHWKEKVGEKIQEELHRSYREQAELPSGLDEMQLVITLLGRHRKKEIVEALTGLDYRSLPTEEGFTPGTVIYDVRENIFIADTPWDPKKVKASGKIIEEQSDLVLWFTEKDEELTPAKKKILVTLAEQKIPVLALFDPALLPEEGTAPLFTDLEETEGVEPLIVDPADEVSVKALSDRIARLLRKRDKEMLYLRITRHHEGPVSRWVMAAAATAFGVGILPLPGPDSLPLTALQTGLCLRLSYVFESTLTQKEQLALMTTTVTSRAGKHLAGLAEELILRGGKRVPPAVKGAGLALVRGLVAAAITYGIGMACYTYYRSGLEGKIQDLSEVFNRFAEEYLKER
jgi:uncharacterized protein (DUF697 family)